MVPSLAMHGASCEVVGASKVGVMSVQHVHGLHGLHGVHEVWQGVRHVVAKFGNQRRGGRLITAKPSGAPLAWALHAVWPRHLALGYLWDLMADSDPPWSIWGGWAGLTFKV